MRQANNFLKADEELVCQSEASAASLSPALVLVSVYSEEMPSPYLEHTSESLCDTIRRPKLSYPHFGDVLVLISNYHL